MLDLLISLHGLKATGNIAELKTSVLSCYLCSLHSAATLEYKFGDGELVMHCSAPEQVLLDPLNPVQQCLFTCSLN